MEKTIDISRPKSGKTPNRKGQFFAGESPIQDIAIGNPNGPAEHESEQMAGQIMRSAATQKEVIPSGHFAAGLQETKGNGHPLAPNQKSQMENAFGTDFSGVRIHSNEKSTKMSKEINAKAFTVGSDIYFQQKYFNPQGGEGRRLLAHELAHTIQQRGTGLTIQREGEEKQDTAGDKPKVETKVEVATEYKEGEVKAKASTTRSGEQKVSGDVTAKASEKTSGDTVTTSAELVAKDKESGISATTGIKAEETPADPTKPDKAKAYFKVGGSWTLFDSKLKLDSSISTETDFKKAPSLSVDGKAIFFPNGRLSPEIAGKFLFDKEGPSGQITPGLNLKITDALSAKAGVPIDIGSDGKVKAGVGLGLVFKFK